MLTEIIMLVPLSLFFLLIVYVIFADCIESDGMEYRREKSTPIASLKIGHDNINGSYKSTFLFASGELNGVTYYKFYKTTEHGNLKFTQIPADMIEIKQCDSEPPQLVEYWKYKLYEKPFKKKLIGTECRTDDKYQVLIIPTNAIELKYDVNL